VAAANGIDPAATATWLLPAHSAHAAITAVAATLTPTASSVQRSTRLRSVAERSLPRPMATSRTADRSMPKRLPAAATNATCTATVTSPSPDRPRWRPIRICTPKAAATPATSPAMFTAVPDSRVRSSLMSA